MLVLSFDDPPKPESINEFSINVTNNGQTPMSLAGGYMEPVEFALEQPFPAQFSCSSYIETIPALPVRGDFVTPKSGREIKFHINEAMTEYIRDARDKRGWIVLCGAVIYKDVFGSSWKHRFCYEYKSPFTKLEMAYCVTENDEIELRGMTPAQLKRSNPIFEMPDIPAHTLYK
jgi:hypothetical protein